MKYISECDVIIYDVHSGNPKDVELAIEAMKKYTLEEEKVLILISSVAVWKSTPPKLVEVGKENAKIDGEGEGEGEGEQPEGEGENEQLAQPATIEQEDGEEEPSRQLTNPAEGEDAIEEGKEQPIEGSQILGEVEDQPSFKEPEPIKEYRNVAFEEKDFNDRIAPPEY